MIGVAPETRKTEIAGELKEEQGPTTNENKGTTKENKSRQHVVNKGEQGPTIRIQILHVSITSS